MKRQHQEVSSSRSIFDSHRRDYVVASLTENVYDGTEMKRQLQEVSSRSIFDFHRRDYVVATLTENVSDGTVMKRQLQEVSISRSIHDSHRTPRG